MSMKNSDFGPRDYSDGRTKQAFKDSCDVNKIIAKAQKAGTMSHLLKYPEATYGEFENIDLLTAHEKVEKAKVIFSELPSEVRREFGNNPFHFAEFAAKPANRGRLGEILPALSRPTPMFPNPVNRNTVVTDAAIQAENARNADEPSPAVDAPAAPEAP